MTLARPIIHQRRILGAVRLRDAITGETVTRPMVVSHPRLGFMRNLSGLYVATGLRPEGADEVALAAHLGAFTEAPATPAQGTVVFACEVTDPAARYLPRRFRLALPRGTEWAEAVAVDLYPAPAAPVAANWSGVRASLRHTAGGVEVPLAGARVRLLRADEGTTMGEGYSDLRGEVLAVVAGLPVVNFSANGAPGGNGGTPSLGATSVAARLEIHTGPGEAWPPDPEAIETSGQAWGPVAGDLPTPALGTGRLETAGLALHLQPLP